MAYDPGVKYARDVEGIAALVLHAQTLKVRLVVLEATGTCQPILDNHLEINSLLRRAAVKVGKLTSGEMPSASCSGVTGLMVTTSGGI